MAAPRGNKNAKGHGRPPFFKETEEDLEKLEALIADYFEWIKGEYEMRTITITDKEGNVKEEPYKFWTRDPEPPTISGLAYHLGFSDKYALYQYRDKDYFNHSIKRALGKVEKHHEMNIAHGDKCTGNIFALKNMGWKDRNETDITTGGEKLPDGKALTPELMAKLIDKL